MTIRKGDNVVVLSGKDRGKKGKVIRVITKTNRVVVERMNVVKKHQKPSRTFPGGIIEKSLSMPMGKVMLVCPRCSEPTRIRKTRVEDKAVRLCVKCEEIIDKG